ncbi:MAG: hypothetical protein PHG00_01675 [Methylococcales bacterium]|nr:hypothetical protein [Methylococcales bacterium]
MSALLKIMAAGFDVSMDDNGGFVIIPASKLTQQQREFLKTHKAEIIEELTAENNAVEWRHYTEPDIKNPLTVIGYTPAGNPVLVAAQDEAHKAFLLRMNPSPKVNQND